MIVSSPRTGSTALATSIANPRKIKLFTEPSRKKETFDEFIAYTSESKTWVSKELIKDYMLYYPVKNFTLVRLRRKNVLEQIASMYISSIRNKWSYIRENLDTYENEILPLDNELITTQVQYTLLQNKMCDQLENVHQIDYDLYYEDINSNFETVMSPTPKPANYNQLCEWITTKIGKNNDF